MATAPRQAACQGHAPTTNLIIEWETVNVKSKRTSRRPAYQWTFWRTEIAGIRFQVGKLPPDIYDFSPRHVNEPWDQQHDACRQLWFAEDPNDWPERMSYLQTDDPEEALRQAEEHIHRYFKMRRESLVRELERQIRAIDEQPVNKQRPLL